MELHRASPLPESELESLGAEIQCLRQPGKNLKLPVHLKARICLLHESGVTGIAIRRATGIQLGSIHAWNKAGIPQSIARPFRVIPLEEAVGEHAPCNPNRKALTFRFAGGKVTADIAASDLTVELLRVLISC